ncbi:Uncharacterized ABC transporter, ATP-binding protein YrbF [Citrobacter freundii]|uniref:Uncharacterized ABC transporter, ATP-binding protein YrbF n=1 Tax=Citrobacter freundii TaxID=546 RepID=A0A7G2IS32_CITFR|nr:Uncharacterized ABC transporter, ATP-binding protein YrbF [Citrobacter freundii]
MGQSVANLVDMRDVSFSRGDRCIFDNISLTVPRGKVTAIMGPSGIGKNDAVASDWRTDLTG